MRPQGHHAKAYFKVKTRDSRNNPLKVMMCRYENKNTDWKGDWRRRDLEKPMREARKDHKDLHLLGNGAINCLHSDSVFLHIKMSFKAQDSRLVRIKFSVSDRNS